MQSTVNAVYCTKERYKETTIKSKGAKRSKAAPLDQKIARKLKDKRNADEKKLEGER